MNWYKTASYNYIVDILNTLERLHAVTMNWKDKEGKEITKKLNSFFGKIFNLSKSYNSPIPQYDDILTIKTVFDDDWEVVGYKVVAHGVYTEGAGRGEYWYEDRSNPFATVEELQSQFPGAVDIDDEYLENEMDRRELEVANSTQTRESYNELLKSVRLARVSMHEALNRIKEMNDPRLESLINDVSETVGIRDSYGEKELDPQWKNTWMEWARDGDIKSKIVIDRESNPPIITLQGLNLGNSQTAQAIYQHMDNHIKQTKTPVKGLTVRGTREMWDRFVDVSQKWLEIPLTKSFNNLPSEKEFNADYQEPVVEEIDPPGGPESKWPLTVTPLNFKGKDSISTVKIGPRKALRGVRLAFDIRDPNLNLIYNYIEQNAGRSNFRFNREETYFDVFEGSIDREKIKKVNTGLRDIEDNTFTKNQWAALSWSRIQKKLQTLKYDNTPEIGAIAYEITGITMNDAYGLIGIVEHAQMRTDKVLTGKMNKNVFVGRGLEPETKHIEKIEAFIQQLQASGVQVPPDMDEEQRFNWGLERKYPDAFGKYFKSGHEITETQREAQKKGIRFIAERTVSILADEPGGGKTMQAVVGADVLRPEGKKILVFTPNSLVDENWLGTDGSTKAPGQFCGHSAEQVAVCKKNDKLSQAIADPNVIWVVVPLSVFSQTWTQNEQGKVFGDILTDAAVNDPKKNKEGLFSALIIDEIQTIKKPESITFGKINSTISSYDIPHRIGLTGTPSDNNPQDVYSGLKLLRHPILEQNKGYRNWTEDMNKYGLANNLLGGQSLAKNVTLSSDDRYWMNEKQKEAKRQELWVQKAKDILEWASTLTPERKLVIMNMFSSTYLRRNKKDISPNIPPKERSETFLDAPTDIKADELKSGWHVDLLKQLARRKVPYTVQKAVQVLDANPNGKVFIVTKHPKVATEIANQLNARHNGIAEVVSGEVDEDKRSAISKEFKEPCDENSAEPCRLRAVVYTMKIGMVGLNFDVASNCIFNDIDWNPSNNLQAEYRVHRITSQRPVNIDYMIFENTYEHEMFNRVQKKDIINDGIGKMMRQANMTTSSSERISLANSFVRSLIENIIIDAGLSDEDQKWFDSEIERYLPVTTPVTAPVTASNWYAQRKYA